MGTGDAGGVWRICWRISEEFAIYMVQYQYCAEYRWEHCWKGSHCCIPEGPISVRRRILLQWFVALSVLVSL